MGTIRDFRNETIEYMYDNVDDNAGSWFDGIQNAWVGFFRNEEQINEDLRNVNDYLREVMEIEDITREKLEEILNDVKAVEDDYVVKADGLLEDTRAITTKLKRFMASLPDVQSMGPNDRLAGLGIVTANPGAVPPGGSVEDEVPRDIPLYNYPGNRSPEAYTQVMQALGVTTESRYAPRGPAQTYCNFFVWDVTIAMGCEIPHVYDLTTGLAVKRDPQNPNHVYMTANRMYRWLIQFGPSQGWNPLTDGGGKTKWQLAIEMANAGYPVILAWPNPIERESGHVAMVAPQIGDDIGTDRVMIYQAGAVNYEYTDLVNGFISEKWDDIIIYWHQ